MSPETIGVLGLIVLIVLILARMWIGAAMAMVGFLGYAYIMGFKPAFGVVAQIPYTTVASYTLTTVPLFILMGEVLFNSEVGKDLYDTAYKWVGQFRGGLAIATVFACALFAAITGVSGPAVVTMGKVALPEMRNRNYDDKLAAGCIVCAGTMAFLIPPSVVFIIYGILTENSIGMLFMAGILPGILLASLFAITVMIITALNPAAGPAGPKTSFKEKVRSLKGTWPAIVLFLLVLGGIYGGIFTPTEAGAIGAFGAIVITAATRRLKFKGLVRSVVGATQTTAFVFLLIVGAYVLMKFLAVSKLTFMLSNTIVQSQLSPYAVLAGVVLLYIILGMFLDVISAVILTTPVLFPLITALGFDPIWYGVVVVILIEMGLTTPPVGLDAFMLAGATDLPILTVFRGAIPFLLAELVCIIILTVFPQIALFLPSTM